MYIFNYLFSMCRDVKIIFSCLFGATNYYSATHLVINSTNYNNNDNNSWAEKIMEANYDENLSENPFFQELQTEHRSTFEKAINEGWIICVPRCGSFTRGSLLEDDFLSHILIPNEEKPGTSFHTLTGREVKLCNRVLTIEYDISKPCSLHMLFEETFYTENLHKYVIWCIDHPLEQGAGTSRDHVPVVTNLRESKDLLWTEVLNKTVLQDLDAEIEEFSRSQDDLDHKPLHLQRDLVASLYAKSLRVLLKDTRLRERTTGSRYFLQTIKIAAETYILHSLRNILPQSISTSTAFEDANLNKIIKNLHELQLKDLGVRSDLCDGVSRGKLELSRLDIFNTVLGKIGCLRRAIKFISQGETSVSSDDLLPVLIFLVIKSGLPNWMAQITFMKHFRFSANSVYEADEAGFLITSLEAAVEHVKSGVLTGSSQPEADNVDRDEVDFEVNEDKREQVTLSYLLNRIKKGDLVEIKRILSKTKEKSINNESKLCHPLCTCDTCERIVARTSHLNWPTLNSRDDRGLTALHIASLYGQVAVVDFLIRLGANVNDADADGATPLHCASSRGYQNTLLLLLHAEADLNATDTRGNTPLHLATDYGHEGCVKALLYFAEQIRLVIDVNAANFTGDTPLHYASKWGYGEIVEILLDHGANPKAINRRGLTPLAVSHSTYVTRMLQKTGSNDSSFLPRPVRKESIKSEVKETAKVKKQVDFAEFTADDSHKITKLLSSVTEGDLCLVSYYLGLDGPLKNSLEQKSNFCHPLCTCEKCASAEEVFDKEDRKPHLGINTCNSQGQTALHVACENGHVEIVQLLLDAGANVNVTNKSKGQTPLHLASLNNHTKVVKLLLNCGNCNINAKDDSGDTPLHLMIRNENSKVAELLLRHGANAQSKNCHAITPLEEAENKLSKDDNLFNSSTPPNIIKILKENYLQ
ncbi:ankyrin repeat domain-containing protein 27-like [Leptopilina heterotoma]|uniref:ankyrin repeat domain-containing protein 27-like n=1 Tax=Leptopilina heterotoma TaxID=63436 RepID=UPI001CA95A41|nr:ankyrin repeat domain-containing protein 27-like [Leptopilina heterotoma]